MSNGEFKWRHDKCMSLIEAYDARKIDFTNPLIKKKDLWDEVAKQINDEHNTDITWDMAYKKFRNLKSTYFHVKDKHANSCDDNATTIRWTYYELFEHIFSNYTRRHFIAAPATPVRLAAGAAKISDHQTAPDPEPAPISNASTNATILKTTIINQIANDNDNDDDYSNETPSEAYARYEASQFRWTYDKNITLLEAYNHRKNKFHDPKIKKKNVWEEIANVINKKHKTDLSGEAAHKKFRNLKSTYIKVKSKLIDSSGCKPIRWEYFDHFEEIFLDPIYTDYNDADANDVDPEDDCSIEIIDTDEFVDDAGDLQSTNVLDDNDDDDDDGVGQDENYGFICNDENVGHNIDLIQDESDNGTYSENISIIGNERLSSLIAGKRKYYQREMLLIEREKLRKLDEIKETNNERNQILKELVDYLKRKI